MNKLRKLWAWLKALFVVPEPAQPTEEPTEPPAAPTVDTPTTDASARKGFDATFLPKRIELPTIDRAADNLLNYRHFTIVMNPRRRLPYYTAVNIDAARYNKLKDYIPSRKEMGSDSWSLDPRMPKTMQLPKSFYKHNDFDLGHMVRREDPIWGDTLEEAIAANDDTFYLTNAAPQHKDFNRSAERWKGLEDYALKNARENDLRLSVFSGCVFDENDRKFEDVQIPGQFWKILVMVKKNGELSATGYIVQQDDLIKDITEREIGFQFEQFKTYQVPITKIEEATGLQFGLNDYDPLQRKRNILDPLPIDRYEDIEF